MKFTKIRLNGLTVIDIPVLNPNPSDPYILKESSGLGPPDLDVSISDIPRGGGVYQGRRVQNREIVLMVGLNPNYKAQQTATELRLSFYGLLTPAYGDGVQIDMMNESVVVASTTGYVSRVEPNPFSSEPQVQVTLPCTDPFLRAPVDFYVSPTAKDVPQIQNIGTAPTGFHFEVIFTEALSSWTLTDVGGKFMQFVYNFLPGDKLSVDTRSGQRSIEITRSLTTSSILSSLTPSSDWLSLYGGVSVFTTSSISFDWGDVYYKPAFWGI